MEFFNTSDLEITKNTYEQSRIFSKVVASNVEKKISEKIKKVSRDLYSDFFSTFEEDMEYYLTNRDNSIFNQVKSFFLSGGIGNNKWESMFSGYSGEKFLKDLFHKNEKFFIDRITEESIDEMFERICDNVSMFSKSKFEYKAINRGYTQDKVIRKLIEKLMVEYRDWFTSNFSDKISEDILSKLAYLDELKLKIKNAEDILK